MNEITRLTDLLSRAGICATCGQEYVHAGDEPLAACGCTDGSFIIEWTQPYPLIWKLREELKRAKRAKLRT
jgi:hypothetical protein